MQTSEARTRWIARILIGCVIGWNIQCAVAFLLDPPAFAGMMGLSGVAGSVAIQSISILFIMWNIPYLAAFWKPDSAGHLWLICLLMQFTGLAGETLLYFCTPEMPAGLAATIQRFMMFDGAGFVLLAAGWILLARLHKK